ncbi:substrate-binding periplasmic protein [Segniliparus rotundus]|uniref:substrate-binding periplasmic protein n=1 Tax=Segniliparus rotundus TaxID=286802 RepID=UPI0002FD26B3|nr:ABC transporter substrate-binding protein [Segniliparus rotundus]
MLRCLTQTAVLSLALFAAPGCAPEDDGPARPADCGNTAALPLRAPGKLTVATDEPAYAPWFHGDDPSNGQGFESALTYAVAGEMGFAKEQVDWVRVPFTNAYAPGEKPFDFDVNEVSITPERRQVVDFSTGYYQVRQVVLGPSGVEQATLAQLAQRSIGVVVGTTSSQAIDESVTPRQPVAYFDTNDLAAQALLAGQVDALVVDLPTGLQIQSANPAAQLTIFGKLPVVPREEFGLVLGKNSPLTSCVDEALGSLQQHGSLAGLERRWLGDSARIPELA